MKKTILIILGVVLAAAIFVTAMLLTDKTPEAGNPLAEPTETTTPGLEIEYYENSPLEGKINLTTQPAESVDLESGKIVFVDGTEKSWLEVCYEQQQNPESTQILTFVNGTTLVNSFNENEQYSEIVIPEGVLYIESCFNNNFVPCQITLPVTVSDYARSFNNTMDIKLLTSDGCPIVVKDDIIYKDSGATLVYYPSWKTETEYVMPDTVKRIASEAITGNTHLQTIKFSSNLETIGIQGVNNCSNITAIELPASLLNMDSVFCNMPNLESINIPDKCVLYGTNFVNCPKLHVTVSENNENYLVENDVIFNKEKTTLFKYLESKTDETFTTPETVTTIGPAAFANNVYLQTLTISEGVTELGTYFANCTGLESVYLPTTIQNIATMTFTRLPNLTSINYADTIEQWTLINKDVDWIISSIEYKVNCTDESTSYKGTA